MIRIIRNRKDEYGVVIRPSSRWFQKANEATKLAISEKKAHDYDSNIYGHNEIRRALEKLFYGKCAYCESNITATHDWNVDHFRPKGRVAENENHLGYYWLTYKWSNLYPSCQHCNQKRRDKPQWADLTMGPCKGKMDQFPVNDENTRAYKPNDSIKKEAHLLLDPCKDNPEVHLKYGLNGQIYSVNNDPNGEATKEICHLTRSRLVKLRKINISETIAIIDMLNKAKKVNHLDLVVAMEIFLNMKMDPSSEYSSVARYIAKDPSAFGVESTDE